VVRMEWRFPSSPRCLRPMEVVIEFIFKRIARLQCMRYANQCPTQAFPLMLAKIPTPVIQSPNHLVS
jgi:hypothetical protein